MIGRQISRPTIRGLVDEAAAIYGLTQGLVFERDYFDMTVRELLTGIRSNPTAVMKTFAPTAAASPWRSCPLPTLRR